MDGFNLWLSVSENHEHVWKMKHFMQIFFTSFSSAFLSKVKKYILGFSVSSNQKNESTLRKKTSER